MVGAETEGIQVAAEVAVLHTESAAVQQEVTGQQIQDQELNGRNPLYMAQFLPGMRSTSTLGDFNFAVGGGQPFQVNGTRAGRADARHRQERDARLPRHGIRVLPQFAFAGPVTNFSSPKYFTVNAAAPTMGTFNLQRGVRDSVYQPGFQDWNIALLKVFPFNERAGVQFRAEAYDFINHPNLCSVTNQGCSMGGFLNPTSSQFGMITAKSTLARNLQLSLRFYF